MRESGGVFDICVYYFLLANGFLKLPGAQQLLQTAGETRVGCLDVCDAYCVAMVQHTFVLVKQKEHVGLLSSPSTTAY
jgi:hypothetical protein